MFIFFCHIIYDCSYCFYITPPVAASRYTLPLQFVLVLSFKTTTALLLLIILTTFTYHTFILTQEDFTLHVNWLTLFLRLQNQVS